jgi:hypothetical protein
MVENRNNNNNNNADQNYNIGNYSIIIIIMITIIFYLELGAYMQLSETVPSANMLRSLPTTLPA